MSTEFKMPNLGPLVDEAKVIRWIKHEGDRIERGDLVVEVDIDKANIELESLETGTLLRILVPEGTTIKPETTLAIIGTPGE